MRTQVGKEFTFEAGHRLMQHDGKCKNLHGHHYIVVVDLGATSVNPQGMVLDFYDLHPVSAFIDRYLDHAMILCEDDIVTVDFCLSHGYKVFTMKTEPTAENLARLIYEECVCKTGQYRIELPKGVKVDSVTVWETPKCSATFLP